MRRYAWRKAPRTTGSVQKLIEIKFADRSANHDLARVAPDATSLVCVHQGPLARVRRFRRLPSVDANGRGALREPCVRSRVSPAVSAWRTTRSFGRGIPATSRLDLMLAVLSWLAVFALISALIADAFR